VHDPANAAIPALLFINNGKTSASRRLAEKEGCLPHQFIEWS
jgi:hypothetical protein